MTIIIMCNLLAVVFFLFFFLHKSRFIKIYFDHICLCVSCVYFLCLCVGGGGGGGEGQNRVNKFHKLNHKMQVQQELLKCRLFKILTLHNPSTRASF